MLKTTHHKLADDSQVYWLIIKKELIWLSLQDGFLPACSLSQLGVDTEQLDALYLGDWPADPLTEAKACYLLDADEIELTQFSAEIQLVNASWYKLREIVAELPLDLFELAAKALQFQQFHQTNRFCGRCGRAMQRVKWEVANHCYHCQHRSYPRLSPCIIVAISREHQGQRQLLLARGKRSSPGKYSILAGFVEPGETIEAAVAREVMEEVGIEIKNLAYFASQPWPFPHNLMLGFHAEHASGAIDIDQDEITEAAWFDIKQLPLVPGTYSIAGRLIEYVKNLSDKA